MLEKALGIAWGERLQGVGPGLIKGIHRAGGCFTQHVLDFRPRQFDGIKVR